MQNHPTPNQAPDQPLALSPKKFSTQFAHSALGEVVGLTVSLGAVYFAHHLLPNQTRAVTHKIAEKLGHWRSTHAHEQALCARKIMDVTLMNIGGLSNMGVQFCLHRTSMKPEDRPPLALELGRLLGGRVAGTVTAIGTLALAQAHAPSTIMKSERQLSKLLGNTATTARFSELFISDITQSVGALVGNVPAQILYDKLVGNTVKPSR